jgi:hypothetical protein
VSGAERALYGLAWHLRRRDTAAREALLAALTPAERAECQAVLELPGVPETLAALNDDELRSRMLSLAGKSMEVPVKDPEVTTILSGGRGAPVIVVREPGWQQQAQAEQEARQRAETKAFIDQLQHEAFIREHSRRPPDDPVAQVHADAKRQRWLDECAEARKWTPERVEAMLDAQETLIRAMMARSPEPPPQPPMRYGRPLSPAEQAYEAAQLDAFLATGRT